MKNNRLKHAEAENLWLAQENELLKKQLADRQLTVRNVWRRLVCEWRYLRENQLIVALICVCMVNAIVQIKELQLLEGMVVDLSAIQSDVSNLLDFLGIAHG